MNLEEFPRIKNNYFEIELGIRIGDYFFKIQKNCQIDVKEISNEF